MCDICGVHCLKKTKASVRRKDCSSLPCSIIEEEKTIITIMFFYRRKDDSRKDVFVKVGQSLKLENTGRDPTILTQRFLYHIFQISSTIYAVF
jgi:hypothetical protein